jgi:hypothetical protein
MGDETGGDPKNSDDCDEVEEFGERIGDETGRKDFRKLDLAEIGEPLRAERKEDKIEAGAARWGK